MVIAKAGEPYVELIPCRQESRPGFGWLKDEVSISADFDSDTTNSAVADLFEGKA